ncbi:unnamed protein product, partial [Soboliphyme baturini]|uniref:AAA domain-containing protein n=1 Tax=Soboliphyme baturini TaxID=241478 RepID=A0A183J207_9BILA
RNLLGVLLYGPPGCGKTLLAKVIASVSGACFINLDISSLTDKWYGETQKLTAAVFSLAAKVQPVIIFVDEIDSVLRTRDSFDHEATAMMKAQFMTMWDGLLSDDACRIVVVGATNRPNDVDKAILRRMPCHFHVGYPNAEQRLAVLKVILRKEKRGDDVNLAEIAAKAGGGGSDDDSDNLLEKVSCSDLKEICRLAAFQRARRYYIRLSLAHIKKRLFFNNLNVCHVFVFVASLESYMSSKVDCIIRVFSVLSDAVIRNFSLHTLYGDVPAKEA